MRRPASLLALSGLAAALSVLPATARQAEPQVPKEDTTPGATDLAQGPPDATGTPVDPLEGSRIQPVINTTYVKVCGGCHVPYQPTLQTADTWRVILERLPEHFGARVPIRQPGDLAEITEYLRRYAGRPGYGVLVGVDADASPLRITELPFFARAHQSVPDGSFDRAGGAYQCSGCHEQAGRGFYRDALPSGQEPEGGQ